MDITPEGAFRRLVVERGGSYCFGHGTVFLQVLRGLGYRSVYCSHWGSDHFFWLWLHCTEPMPGVHALMKPWIWLPHRYCQFRIIWFFLSSHFHYAATIRIKLIWSIHGSDSGLLCGPSYFLIERIISSWEHHLMRDTGWPEASILPPVWVCRLKPTSHELELKTLYRFLSGFSGAIGLLLECRISRSQPQGRHPRAVVSSLYFHRERIFPGGRRSLFFRRLQQTRWSPSEWCYRRSTPLLWRACRCRFGGGR